jgi:hypothetical protein
LVKIPRKRQVNFVDAKGIIRGSKSKKDIHYNGQRKNDKRINNDLQKTPKKPKD